MRFLPNGENLRARSGGRLGIAAVELAAVATFLGLIFVVAVDFARVFYYQMVLDNCARNGAMFGANLPSYLENGGWVSPDNSIAGAAVADGAGLNPPLATNQVSSSYGKGSDGNKNITVTINYTFTAVTPLPGIGNTINLTAKAKMRAYQ
jgi:hypothetical protein